MTPSSSTHSHSFHNMAFLLSSPSFTLSLAPHIHHNIMACRFSNNFLSRTCAPSFAFANALSNQSCHIFKGNKHCRKARYSLIMNTSHDSHQDTKKTATTIAGLDTTQGLNNLLESSKQRYIFVGGKGGVGKTSTSTSIALAFANKGIRTLLISTDPAHSIADSLDIIIAKQNVPIPVDIAPKDKDNNHLMYAMEIDPSVAAQEFKAMVEQGNNAPGGAGEWLDKLGIAEFTDVLETLPPGADEFVALSKVMALADGVGGPGEGLAFERIVIDTAPTGHTLRLLAFPDFLDSLLEKTSKVRKRFQEVKGLVTLLGLAVSGSGIQISQQDVERVAAKEKEFRKRLERLSALFRNPARAEFIIVSIPTDLSVFETKRLVEKLNDDGIWVRHIIVNMYIASNADQQAFMGSFRESQDKSLQMANETFKGLNVANVGMFDTEVRGVYGLKAYGMVAFPNIAHNDSLLQSKLVFMGGKGGVGKTTSSASLGIRLAEQGKKVLVVSTDPAHSLGDAFDVPLLGKKPVPIEGTDGNLFAMEIDTEASIAEFRQLILGLTQNNNNFGGDLARQLGLEEFAGILDNIPPGIDELVALTKVIEFLESGEFDLVVIDTAPSGHTLRLLAFPDFLDGFLTKVISLKTKIDAMLSRVQNIFSSGKKVDIESAAQKVDLFRKRMVQLRDITRDEMQSEFFLVSIPSYLSVSESGRLIGSLKDAGVTVRNVVINQIVPEHATEAYVTRRIQAQSKCISSLEQVTVITPEVQITKVPFAKEEVRGLNGLTWMGSLLFPQSPKS